MFRSQQEGQVEVRTRSSVRKTKIVCTVGPATSTAGQVRGLIAAGMDVARLNFSHGEHDTHRGMLRTIRHVSKDMGKEIGILQDLGGPKIRLGKLPVEERLLETEERVVLSPSGVSDPSDPAALPVNYPYIVEDVAVGDRILLADGLVEIEVEEKETDRVVCRVVIGGVVHSHKGINLPTSNLRISAFTAKDREDLTVGIEEGVDFVALSFVRHEKDLEPLRDILNRADKRPMLIAKIEKPQAIQRLEAILAHVDAVMVARGDLGVEMPIEEVPMIQKRIIRLARHAAKPVITATQMLRSMVSSPRPTRAEVTDVANAILDGTDAVMLSEETAIGAYPAEAVRVLDRVAQATEAELQERPLIDEPMSESLPPVASAISRAACSMAEYLGAAAIVAGTSSGSTARLVSRFRPGSPVVGLTPSLQTQRQLTLSWGVIPALVPSFANTDQLFTLASAWALEQGLAQAGDRLVVTAGVPVGTPGSTNLLKVIELKETGVTDQGLMADRKP